MDTWMVDVCVFIGLMFVMREVDRYLDILEEREKNKKDSKGEDVEE